MYSDISAYTKGYPEDYRDFFTISAYWLLNSLNPVCKIYMKLIKYEILLYVQDIYDIVIKHINKIKNCQALR